MSHLNPGLISAYNSLTDRHLAGYFSNTRIRRHLQRAGLITRSGRIVPDKEYRHKLIQRTHQRHIRECLAQAIFHKVLEMERVHQIEIKRKLEEFARRERVHKIKVDRSKRYEEEIIRILSPRPPSGARCIRKQHSGPEGEHSESSESPGSSRPNTAPVKMQRPVRLKPIHSNSTTTSLRRSSPHRVLESSNENDLPFNSTMEKTSRRRLNTTEVSRGISPYCLPVINNFVTPVPPATKRKERGAKVNQSGTLRGRRLRLTSSGADVNEDPTMLRSSVHQSRVCVNMMYFGKAVHLSHDLTDMGDEVKVFQQHCGGENLCVFKGKLREGETFQFISRRHRGFPFSLTFFLNGLQVERLSSCCEFKHRKGSRLGGRHGHFGFCSVEGASPCYKCIIAMGLDKKPTPPPKRVKEDEGREESVSSHKDAPEMETERTGDDAASHSECETSQPQDTETQIQEETAAKEDKVRDDYEEDFEADDEGPPEDVDAKEKKTLSPSGENERQVKERDASESEDDEKDEDIKSHSGSSSSGSDREESDAEATKDSREEEKAEQPKEVDQEETVVPPDEKEDEPNPEEAAATEAESAVPKDSDIQDSAMSSTEMEVYETSVPSGNENKQSDDTSGDKEVEKTVDENKQEEEQERAKSVQEKLAEAILKESHCSSEPELSDTSTEEDEESTDKGPEQDSQDAVAVESVTVTEEQQTLEEVTKCEEGVVGEAEVEKDHDETSEPKDRENETEQEPLESSESTKEEKVKIEEDEKASSDEDKNTAENDKPEDTEDTSLHPVSEEEMTEDKTSEDILQEDAAGKSTDGEAAEKDEENEEKTAGEADVTGQGTKSVEEDESSVSELIKKTDETAAPDKAEEEAMTASETMEMKAEPSKEREALNYEEAPITEAEKRQQGDCKDRDAASETEVTAENSSSSLEGSADTTVEKTADTSEGNAKDESGKDDIKEEEVSEVEDSKDDNQHHGSELGEEQIEKSSVEIDDEIEEKCEEEGNEETNPDEKAEGENREESEKHDEEKTEEEKNNESKTEERIENNESISELTKSDSNTEGNADGEQAEEPHSEEEVKVANEEKEDKSEKTEMDEDAECAKNKNDEEDSEETGAATDKTNECEMVNMAADAEKDDEAEKEEKDQNEDKDENVGENGDGEESEEKKVVTDKTVEGEEMSEIPEESEKSEEADLDKDNVKISEENIAESEDFTVSEAANVAQGTKTAEEKPNNAVEAEDVMKETEGGSDKSDKGELDVENGEISTRAENKADEDEGEAQTEGKDDVKTEVNTEEGRKTEEPTEGESSEVKEVTVESGDIAEKHEDGKADEAPEADVVEVEDGNDGAEKQDGSTKNDSEPETSGTKVKEESKSDDSKDGETKQDGNGNNSDPENDNRGSDLMTQSDNVQSNVSEVIAASAVDQAPSSSPNAVDSDDTPRKLDESTAPSDSVTDKQPHADENAAAADLCAADGENGADTEEASKASEEGASVLLKPQAPSSQLPQNNEDTEESVAVGNDTPEALAREDNTDLVTNWVTMHQTSKYFETFVEPLEDLKDSTSDTVSNSNEEATQSTELTRSASPLKMAKVSENLEQEDTLVETVVSKLESNHSEDSEQREKDKLQVEEEPEVKDVIPETESEQNDKESVSRQDVRSEHKGSRGSLEEDKVQEGLMQDNSERTDISKTEVESIAGTHHSVTSGRPESVSENQTEEITTDNGAEKPTTIEEVKDLLPSSKTDEHHKHSTGPEGLSRLKADEPNDSEETQEKDDQSREVTEITDFTTSKSDDGSQEESQHKDMQPKTSDASINGDKRDGQLIKDIKHTLSKDRLSTFSVDETMFGRSSYPLLTAARTESGH
ncbi:LOW QUALITY PROTEIN: glutamate-rich protein 3 [Anoplopoma fimbria]|uniref:LOW QUALITY PROTEIN: glutamate-rich protein 3 n=1 Tax=Anoplopoma fimbria TaxID=229290 RepID=UPI0023EC490C|nr:LOW QUALITY PROTEIN: glutamate-rich protein 3 [Anoplopoma fimbria]